MSRRDSVFGTNVALSLASAVISGSETSASVNADASHAPKFVFLTAAVGTDIIIKLQESVDDSVWTDVDATEVVSDSFLTAGQLTIPATGGDNTATQLGYVGCKQYSRFFIVSGAGTLGATSQVDPDFYCEATS